MSSLFNALKNLEKRQAQSDNPFVNASSPQDTDGRRLLSFLKQFFSRPFGLLTAVLLAAVVMGFVALFAMDWYIKKIPLQPRVQPQTTVQRAAEQSPVQILTTPQRAADQSLVQTQNSLQPSTPTIPVSSENQPKDRLGSQASQPTMQTAGQSMSEGGAEPSIQRQTDASIAAQPVKKMDTAPQTSQDVPRAMVANPAQKKQQQVNPDEQTDDMEVLPTDQRTAKRPVVEPIRQSQAQINVVSPPMDDLTRWRKSLLEQAEILRREGKFHEAIPLYQKLWDAVRDPAIANNLAGLYIIIGNPQEAVAILNEAIKLSPQDEDIRYNLELASNMLKTGQER